MRIRGTVELAGKTATGITVPAEVVTALGSSKRPAVRVTINGYTYRTTIAPMGGVFRIPVSGEVRSKAAVAAGDVVNVDIELDTYTSRGRHTRGALDQRPDARRRFDALSNSNKQRRVLPIEAAKTPETRQRRIAKTVSDLSQTKD